MSRIPRLSLVLLSLALLSLALPLLAVAPRFESVRPSVDGAALKSALCRPSARKTARLRIVAGATGRTNAGPGTRAVVERVVAAGVEETAIRPLGLSWPQDVYSLSHVALPFPPDDPLFGCASSLEEGFRVRLGTLQPRGERTILAVPVDQPMRLTWNPFFPFLEESVRERAVRDGT